MYKNASNQIFYSSLLHLEYRFVRFSALCHSKTFYVMCACNNKFDNLQGFVQASRGTLPFTCKQSCRVCSSPGAKQYMYVKANLCVMKALNTVMITRLHKTPSFHRYMTGSHMTSFSFISLKKWAAIEPSAIVIASVIYNLQYRYGHKYRGRFSCSVTVDKVTFAVSVVCSCSAAPVGAPLTIYNEVALYKFHR